MTEGTKGDTYYYFQYSDPGGIKRQIYIGRGGRYLEKVACSHSFTKATVSHDPLIEIVLASIIVMVWILYKRMEG